MLLGVAGEIEGRGGAAGCGGVNSPGDDDRSGVCVARARAEGNKMGPSRKNVIW